MNHRFRNHGALLAVTVICLGVSAASGPGATAADRLSIVSAYLCLFLLGVALAIGPANAIRKGKALVNVYARRDTGIWAALNGLLHFFLANVLAMNYEYLGIYVENAPVPPSVPVREALYLWGTILGYVIAVLFIMLMGLSNDWMVRKVGLKWWKRLQRASYAAFIFTCAHAFMFQVLETRAAVWVVVVALVTVLIIAGQGLGIAAIRKLRDGKPRAVEPARG
ncbi:MAG: ferric reductase-like transmembrane domain-containing protein [Chromatiales bacterium]|nr:MAG: ferric reductase-like transmembrane domain-containing protein [Chromatiales bacterium]